MPGLRLTSSGADVAIHAPTADLVELCLFDGDGSETRLPLSRDASGWHRASVPGIEPGRRYGFRTHGPWKPEEGLWHHPDLLLLDPFALAVSGAYTHHPAVGHHGERADTAPHVPRSVAAPTPPRPRPGPQVPWEERVIYETHVRGLTKLHPDVPEELRGTFLGAATPPVIDHVKRMGVTTVELLPVAHHVTEPFLQHRGLTNYWGYSTLAWFAPHAGYSTGEDGRQLVEFAEMVDRFHEADLEVVVDVVFNHTAEGDLNGPILSYKGIDNRGWYRLDENAAYIDWTGTGNTIDTGNQQVRTAILEALRWWATDLGVDGFRFDLAVTLGRDGGPDFDPRHLEWITREPALAEVVLIAEPWDLGPHGYRLGGFPPGWSEWNGAYRDQVRDLWRGHYQPETVSRRIGGSGDIFGDRHPDASVNFITAHDGFTLADLVAYDHKHNWANGEDNRDGHDDNRSWNSGVEGPTDDPQILQTRKRRAASMLMTLLLSAGTPMIQGGDELASSLQGNNNAYALDEPNWYRWEEAPFADLIAAATSARRSHPGLRSPDRVEPIGHHPLVVEIEGQGEKLLLVANPSDRAATLSLPPDRQWEIELGSTEEMAIEPDGSFTVGAWSVCLLSPRGDEA